MKYNFLYADFKVDNNFPDVYVIGKTIHADSGVRVSSLRGGLLNDCNLRLSFVTGVNESFQLQNEDYRNQHLFIFDLSYDFIVLDNYRVGDYTQVLLCWGTPTKDEVEDVTKAARNDFNQLINKRPVGVLDNTIWRKKLGKPIGTDRLVTPHTQTIF